MGLTADQVFEKIGSFGRYQLFMLIIFNILEWFWFGWPVLVMTFLAAEPSWRCVGNYGNHNHSNNTSNSSYSNSSIYSNSTGNRSDIISVCPLSGTMAPGHKNYSFRCDIPRNAWEFVDDLTSVVTEVSRNTGEFTEYWSEDLRCEVFLWSFARVLGLHFV